MGAPTIVSVEVERPNGRLREWEDALSAHVGRVDPVLREQEAVRCLPMDERPFEGAHRIWRTRRNALVQGGVHQLSIHPLIDHTDTDIANPGDARFGLQRELQIRPTRPHLHSDPGRLDPDRHDAAARSTRSRAPRSKRSRSCCRVRPMPRLPPYSSVASHTDGTAGRDCRGSCTP